MTCPRSRSAVVISGPVAGAGSIGAGSGLAATTGGSHRWWRDLDELKIQVFARPADQQAQETRVLSRQAQGKEAEISQVYKHVGRGQNRVLNRKSNPPQSRALHSSRTSVPSTSNWSRKRDMRSRVVSPPASRRQARISSLPSTSRVGSTSPVQRPVGRAYRAFGSSISRVSSAPLGRFSACACAPGPIPGAPAQSRNAKPRMPTPRRNGQRACP
jgi:hypothetical protein